MPRKILVIGAGGFIGRHLVKMLETCGDQVLAAGPGSEALASLHVDVYPRPLRRATDFAPLIAKSDLVAYLASSSTPASTAGDPVAELERNLQPLTALLKVLQKRPDVPLLYLSSGGTLYTRSAEDPADEHAAIHPRSYHGAGKAACEYFIGAWCAQFGGNACIVRPSNVYGPGQHARTGFAVIPTAFERIRNGEVMHVWGDGSATRDYLYVEDLVDLCKRILHAFPSGGPHVFNASSGHGVSLTDLLEKIAAVAGQRLALHFEPGRAVDAQCVLIDASASRRAFEWIPRVGLAKGLQRTWTWLKSSPR